MGAWLSPLRHPMKGSFRFSGRFGKFSGMKSPLVALKKLNLGIGLAMLLVAHAPAADWPQWRGPERTGWVASSEQFPTTIASEPKVVWRLEIGGGFSSPVVAGGKLVYLDAQDQQEVAHLVDAATGKEAWRTPIAAMYQDEWGPGPRSTPLID